MFTKPKSAIPHTRALIYKRFTDLEKSSSLNSVYETADGKYWLFDKEQGVFAEYDFETTPQTPIAVASDTYLQFKTNYYHYAYYSDIGEYAWELVTTLPSDIELLSAKYANVARYQVNRYYFVGSIRYMYNSNDETSDGQPIKGLITPQSSFTIRTFDDEPKLDHDDLVVIGGRLYSIESIEISRKYMPKPFTIYFATLNNIL